MKNLMGEPLSLVISLVSHGHGAWILSLIEQIHSQQDSCVKRVVLTLNVPEPDLEQQLRDKALLERGGLHIEIVRNRSPKGFGCNHNAALMNAIEDVVCILNPDITLLEPATFSRLAQAVREDSVGLGYPIFRDEHGGLQDNERALPTFPRLLRRRMGGTRETTVDWVSGACMVLKNKDWKVLGGFNERFFMYCEDVDLSLRVRQQIGILKRVPVVMQHQAQRASRRKLKFLLWHIRSLLVLWSLPSFRWGRKNLSQIQRMTAPSSSNTHN